MGHRRGTAALLAAAAVCLLAAGIGAYGMHAVLDERAFAERAASTLRSDEVRAEVASRMGERLSSERPELAASATTIEEAAAGGVAGDPRFRAAFATAAARLHDTLLHDPDAEASLRVPGSGAALRAELARRFPAAGERIPQIDDVPLLAVGGTGPERALRRLAPVVAGLALPAVVALALAGLALMGLAVARRPDRSAAWALGLTVAAAAGLAAAGATAAADFVLSGFDTDYGDAVVSEVWAAYVGDLRTWALAVCAAGLVVAAAAGGPRPSPRLVLAPPVSRRGRLGRGAGLLVLAALAVQAPELVLHTGLVALAAALFYVAAGDLLRVLAPPQRAGRRVRAAASAAALIGLIAAAPIPASGTEHLPAGVDALPERAARVGP